MFKIISCGWQCAQYIEQTLASVEDQTRDDWQHMVVYDLSTDNGADLVATWADGRLPVGKREYQLNMQQHYAPHNQWDAIQALDPADDDILIWLDLDGDRLAHSNVLSRVAAAYADGTTLLTYGNYRAVPEGPEPSRVLPIPDEVVANNTYRDDARYNGIRVNHLRTMKGVVAKSIPISTFQWPDGSWYMSGADYGWMISGLERVAGRYKCIEEVLLLYNHANPLADNIHHGQDTHKCDLDFMSKPPLERLP